MADVFLYLASYAQKKKIYFFKKTPTKSLGF